MSGGLESQRAVLEDAGKRLAMHVVAAKPSFLGRSSVPGDVLERETAICRWCFENDIKGHLFLISVMNSIYREQTEATSAGKKTEIIEKMVSGKLSKRLAEICLMDQVLG